MALDGNMNATFTGAFASWMNNTLFKSRFAAKVLLVQLYDSIQRGNSVTMGFHHGADGMTDFPGSLLAHADPLGQKKRMKCPYWN